MGLRKPVVSLSVYRAIRQPTGERTSKAYEIRLTMFMLNCADQVPPNFPGRTRTTHSWRKEKWKAFECVPGHLKFTHRGQNYNPGYASVDLAVVKNTAITERVSAQLRADIINIFNHTNLAAVGFPTAGETSTIGSTIGQYLGNPGIGPGEPVNAQLALKIIFCVLLRGKAVPSCRWPFVGKGHRQRPNTIEQRRFYRRCSVLWQANKESASSARKDLQCESVRRRRSLQSRSFAK